MTLRLNLGCGQAPTEGWLNYDNSPAVRLSRWPALAKALAATGLVSPGTAQFARFCRAADIRHADACRLPHAAGTVDAIYACHMIEHLDRDEAWRFVEECRRVLRPGGVLRLAVPDLARLARLYANDGDAEAFMARLQVDLDRPRGLLARLSRLLTGGRGHHWMYDGASLVRMLGDAGFAEAIVLPAGRTRIADPGRLDLAERAEDSVYVEAVRPLP